MNMNIAEALKFFTGPTLAMFLSGLLLAVFGLVAALKKDDTPRWVHGLGFAAAILVALASVWGAIDAGKDSLTIKKKTQRIADLAETNVVLSAKLAETTAQSSALLAGGHNYCSFYAYVHPPNTLNWWINHRNDHVHVGDKINAPVLDVKAVVYDIGKLTEQANVGVREALKTLEDPDSEEVRRLISLKTAESWQEPHPGVVTRWDIGTVLPYENSRFRKTQFEDTDELWFKVLFYARNGRWQETIILKKVNGKWENAHKMDKTSGYCPDIRQTGVSRSHGFPTNDLPSRWK